MNQEKRKKWNFITQPCGIPHFHEILEQSKVALKLFYTRYHFRYDATESPNVGLIAEFSIFVIHHFWGSIAGSATRVSSG
jgi:hypothetical protein